MANSRKLSYYEILSVQSNASEEEIHQAYRKCLLAYHPDKPSTDLTKTQQAEKFIQIREAHDCLMDAKKRAAYDKTLKSYAMPFFGQHSFGNDVVSKKPSEQKKSARDESCDSFKESIALIASYLEAIGEKNYVVLKSGAYLMHGLSLPKGWLPTYVEIGLPSWRKTLSRLLSRNDSCIKSVNTSFSFKTGQPEPAGSVLLIQFPGKEIIHLHIQDSASEYTLLDGVRVLSATEVALSFRNRTSGFTDEENDEMLKQLNSSYSRNRKDKKI